jgi:hypothetical protein
MKELDILFKNIKKLSEERNSKVKELQNLQSKMNSTFGTIEGNSTELYSFVQNIYNYIKEINEVFEKNPDERTLYIEQIIQKLEENKKYINSNVTNQIKNFINENSKLNNKRNNNNQKNIFTNLKLNNINLNKKNK